MKSLSVTVAATLLFMMVVFPLTGEPPSIRPFKNARYHKMTSGFGIRMHPILKERVLHRGIDFAMPTGTPVVATAKGKVIKVAYDAEGYGNYIKVQHDEAFVTLYSTLSEVSVKEGQTVQKGQVIGQSGNTGMSTAPHLHYEVIKDGQPVDPAGYFE